MRRSDSQKHNFSRFPVTVAVPTVSDNSGLIDYHIDKDLIDHFMQPSLAQ